MEMVVHPLSKWATRAVAASQLQPGTPAAPRRHSLPLLPPGPGGVWRLLPRGTRPSTLL